MASTTFSGPVTSTNGFVGDVTGNVTGSITGVEGAAPTATETTAGTVRVAAFQADAAGANPTAAEYDALLAALIAAGIMAAA